MNYSTHPLADIFPMMLGDEFDNLKKDIAEHGLREPIWIMDGQILDGRNRFKACREVGVEPVFRKYTGDNPAAFVISLNLHRRHLNESQRAMVAAKLANMPAHRVSDKSANLQTSQTEAANLLNVSTRTVGTAKKVAEQGVPELVQAVESGEVSVSAAADVAELPKSEQAEIVARGEKEILEKAREIRAAKAEKKKAEVAQIKAENPVIVPKGKFSCIVIDPPWDMKKIERDARPNQVEFDYPTMSEDELTAFPLAGMSADDCHLFCWTTQKYLPMSLRLLDAWDFRYVLTMVWHKPGGFQPIGLPQYNCEFVLYARRGSPEFVDTKAFPCCFQAPRREHSRKPDEFYDLIKRVTDGPRIDVFSREAREGFDQFGNETTKFEAA